MSQSSPSDDLTVENTPKPPEPPATAGAQTLQAAPAAVKRSWPMALSLCLGILLAALGAWFFYKLTWFILLLYLSFVAATILDAPVQWLKHRGIRRGFAALIVMVGGLAIITTGLYFLGSGVYNQIAAVSTNLEQAPKRINDTVNGFKHHFMHGPKSTKLPLTPKPPSNAAPALAVPPAAIEAAASAATAPATEPATAPATIPAPGDFDVAASLVNSAPSLGTIWANTLRSIEVISWLVIMFFIVLYMLIDGADHLKALRTLLPKHLRLEATKLFNELARAHRGWALASLSNVCSATILIGSGLYFLGVPGAYVLGFIAGLGELIPNIGPVMGAVPALLFVLIAEPDKFFYVLGMIVIAQTIQSYTITPQMLKFSIEMPVLVTIISVLVFGTLFGFLGVLVAIPLVADMVVIWNYVAAWREKDTTDYDCVNAPSTGTREAVPYRPSRLRTFFHRPRQNPSDNAAEPPHPDLHPDPNRAPSGPR